MKKEKSQLHVNSKASCQQTNDSIQGEREEMPRLLSTANCLLILVVLFLSILNSPSEGQQALQIERLIDSPTAGLLPKGSFDIDLRLFDKGGILGAVGVGLADRLSVGFSFGGEGIIGSQDIDWNPKVGFRGKYRLFEESLSFAALVIGFESQGFGGYDDEHERYDIKSKGFYAALSRNFATAFGRLGLHGGVNRTLEDKDQNDDISGYIGLDKGINSELSLLVEYDFAINDSDRDDLFSGEGYLNAGARWNISSDFSFEFDVKDLISKAKSDEPSRELRIIYFERF